MEKVLQVEKQLNAGGFILLDLGKEEVVTVSVKGSKKDASRILQFATVNRESGKVVIENVWKNWTDAALVNSFGVDFACLKKLELTT